MNLLEAAVLGIIEGLTEFLPISSTGHLILASYLLGIPETSFLKSFEIAIQLGAVCAVLALYWRSFLDPKTLLRLAAAFIPTGIIGLVAYPFVKGYLLGSEHVVVLALALGGAALIAFELLHKEKPGAAASVRDIGYGEALGVGFFQAIAIIPGVSRSGATILGGLLLGIRRTAIVEFSFLLAVPTMLAATGLDILKSYDTFSGAALAPLAVGFLAAFAVALVVIRVFLRFVRSSTFIPFGVYRIVLAAVFWLAVL